MTSRSAPKPKGFRRLERWLVGIAMAVVAFILERLVMRGGEAVRSAVLPDLRLTASEIFARPAQV